MRICVKITGRWIRAKHFLNDKEIDRIMLIVLNSNQFSVYEDGKLKQEYKIDEVADQMIFEDDIEYSWMEKRGKAVPLADFTVEYESGEGAVMSYEFDLPTEFDISKLKFSRVLTNCKMPEVYGDDFVYMLEPVIGYGGKTIFTWEHLEQQENLGEVDFTSKAEVSYPAKLRGKYSTPINTFNSLIYADPEKTLLVGHTKRVPEFLVVPEGVKEIIDECFVGCEAIKTAKFPSTLEKIGRDVFRGCEELKELTFLSDIELDFDNEFIDWTKITNINFENSSRYKFKDGIIYSADEQIMYRACAKEDC
jgi:hypothetical protein